MKISNVQTRPTFIGIGGHKCASTWLSECLRYHPEVFVSSPKEIHFFDDAAKFARGEHWYLKHFEQGAMCKAVGEVTATYLAGTLSVKRMRKVLGDVTIVVSLRDPVSRFLSQYKHYIRKGDLPKSHFRNLNLRTLRDAIERCPTLLGNGQYHQHLSQFYEEFGEEWIHVILKDEIDTDPKGALKGVFAAIGVDPTHFSPVLEKRISPGIVPKYPVMESMRRRMFCLARRYSPRVIDLFRRSGVAEMYRRLNREKQGEDLVLQPGVEQRLYQMYQQDIQQTERLTGKSLSAWKRPTPKYQAA